MDLLDHLRTRARANRLANHRLHTSMATLADADADADFDAFAALRGMRAWQH